MPLIKSKGNMYDWVTHTWNTIKGQCYHDCSYCYMKRWGKQPPIHFDERELKTDLGRGNMIFVGNTNDMFAEQVSADWIIKTIEHCRKFDNTYVFQTKNVFRFNLASPYPEKYIIGTTIETNRADLLATISKAPSPFERAEWIADGDDTRFITIEPIMDFDLIPFAEMIIRAKPSFVNIGADSKGHNLPEPSKEKVLALIYKLTEAGIEIRKKTNLKRLV